MLRLAPAGVQMSVGPTIYMPEKRATARAYTYVTQKRPMFERTRCVCVSDREPIGKRAHFACRLWSWVNFFGEV